MKYETNIFKHYLRYENTQIMKPWGKHKKSSFDFWIDKNLI